MKTIRELKEAIEGLDENTEILIDVKQPYGDRYDCSIEDWNYTEMLNKFYLLIILPEDDE